MQQQVQTVTQLTPKAYQATFVAPAKSHFLLDVRAPEEFKSGHITGAANIAVEVLAQHLQDIPRDQPIVLYCRSGRRSAFAATMLQQAGYNPVYDLGGVLDWTAQGYPLK